MIEKIFKGGYEIVARPRGGLCNRLRAVHSTYVLSKKFDKNACVIWVNDEDQCACNFIDIFQSVPLLEIHELNNDKSIKRYIDRFYFNSERSKPKKLFTRLVNKILFDETIGNIKTKNYTNSKIRRILKTSNSIYFVTGHDFVKKNYYSNIFTPKKHIQEKVHCNTKNFNSKTFGIHIRMGKHIRAKRKSPVQAFIPVIRRLIRLDNDIRFFLATDSSKVKKEIKKLFGDRVMTTGVPLNRSSVSGIEGAVIDLYSLAATKKIYGSCVSTFADTAAKIGNVDLVRVTKNLSKAFSIGSAQ